VSTPEHDERVRALARVARGHAGLKLLVLYGSRARGEARPGSDWDLGYLADATFDPDAFLAGAVGALEADTIDLVDLSRASGQLRYRAAAEALVVFARSDEAFGSFWLDAVTFWCDAAPVLRAGYGQVLKDLAR
jgi:predicted nucleotidyltransferase